MAAPKSCFEPNSHGISTNIDKQNGWEFQIAISTKFGCKGWVRPELTQSCHARLGEAKLAILAVSFLLLHFEDYLLWGMAVYHQKVWISSPLNSSTFIHSLCLAGSALDSPRLSLCILYFKHSYLQAALCPAGIVEVLLSKMMQGALNKIGRAEKQAKPWRKSLRIGTPLPQTDLHGSKRFLIFLQRSRKRSMFAPLSVVASSFKENPERYWTFQFELRYSVLNLPTEPLWRYFGLGSQSGLPGLWCKSATS